MNRIIVATALAASGALALSAAGYTAAQAATVQPAAVHAPHVTRCAAQLRAVNAAERGEIGARGLAAAGLPELAETARAADTLAGARWYGVALEATASSLRCDGKPLPGWVKWGGTSDRSRGLPCIVIWGGNGATSAEVCKAGTAYVS